ncbi:MAG TPA: ExeM/NucH family extracellular endonuclease [Candidatus Limnocylindria bacterium]
MSVTHSMPIQRGLALLVALALALGALLPLAAPAATRAAPTELFFSEYIEGSSNNKALEIFNGTGGAIDLTAGGYSVQMFFNGSATPGLTINLAGSVADGDVFVLAHSSATAPILAQADQTNGSGWFNGDDAVALRMGTTVIDVIGQVGFDPGSEWGSGLTSTADNTLRRKAGIEAGDAAGADAFDPGVEWDGFATDTFAGLGVHGDADVAPSVTSTAPVNGATGVPGTTNLSVTFSEPVAVAEGWYTIACTTSDAVTATVSGGPTSWTLDPDVGLVDEETCTVTIVAANVTDLDVVDPPDTMAADHVFSFTIGNICTTPSHLISDVQGPGATTPVAGQTVSVRGVVTADFTSGGASGLPNNQGLRGFFLEAGTGDRDEDPATSEGIFVFDGDGSFTGGVGDVVAVAGSASEFSGVTQITETQILACELEIELPAAVALPLPLAPADRNATLEPLESMRVSHPELTVTEFFQLERFGEIRLSADGALKTPTNVHLPNSPEAIALAAANAAATIILDDGRSGQNLNLLSHGVDYLPYVRAGETLRIGDQLLDHVAVLHFGFGVWRLQPVDLDAITDELAENRMRPRDENPPEVGGTLKVASFNVLNYFDGDGQGGGFPTTRGAVTPSELERQTEKLVDAITRLGADVYGLIEIENDGGEFQATRTLVDALNAEAGSEVYRFVDTGVIGTDEIKQAFIYDRRTVRPVGDWAILTSAVDPRFDDDLSRPALAQSFVRLGSGERVTVVVNHLKSKGQSGLEDETDPNFDQGDGQGFWNVARTQAAEALADWVASNPTGENVIGTLIIGDLNAYGREDPIRALEDSGYEDQLVRFSEGAAPYTFTFDGQQGTLDTALATETLAARVTGAAVWHLNADEVPAIDYQESVGVSFNQRFRTAEIANAYYDPSAFRSSDHDPVLIGLELRRSPKQLQR